MRLDVILLKVMHIVRCDRGDAQPVGQVHQLGVQHLLFRNLMILQLDEEAVRPEDFQVGLGQLLRGGAIAIEEGLGDFSADTSTRTDQTARKLA